MRYIRKVPKYTSLERIGAALQEGGMRYDEYFIQQTIPQSEFRGVRKFVKVRVANQMVADKLAQVVKEMGKKCPW